MTSQKKRRSSRGATVSADTSALPLVSVILPVRNESGFIGRCIEALAAQTYPPDRLEIIMVDGDSTDSTLEEARSTAAATGLKIAVKTNPRRTTATGFNLGLNEARGDVIVRVDGHTRVDSDFVAASISALNDSDASAVGGPIRTEGEGPIGRAIALAMSSPFGIGDAVFRHADAQEQWTDSVPFGAYRREVFDRLGGLAEDVD